MSVMKVYIARNKETGNAWRGKKVVYESIGGLKSAMKTSCFSADFKDYDIYSWELIGGVLEK